MNKFKKACEDLAVYLNKDVKGVLLLMRVTRIGNEVRNELASMVDAKARADSNCKNYMEIAAKVKSELSLAKAERQQHLDTIASLRSKVAGYEKQAVKEEGKEEGFESLTLEITPKAVSRLLRDAINDKQHYKAKINRDKDVSISDLIEGTVKPDLIKLQENISNLSYAELAKLGRLVAIFSIMTGHVVVTSPCFSSLYDPNNPETEAVEATNRLLMRFLKPRCDFSNERRQQSLYAESQAHPIVTKE